MIGRRGPNVAMHEVGDALQLPASTMTSIVDRLVQSGLVVRGTVPTDRRAVVATLTPEGRALVAGIEAQRHRDLAAMLGDVDDDELVTFAGLLTRMLSGIDRSLAELCLEGVPKQAAGA
jgi:DNA-binding MarR family transcriptional regulator